VSPKEFEEMQNLQEAALKKSVLFYVSRLC
jgi:hypothetical protein